MPEESKRNNFAVLGFVLSLCGVVATVLYWSLFREFARSVMRSFKVLGFLEGPEVLGILGIVFSSIGISKAGKGFGRKTLAIAGLVLGIIAAFTVLIPGLNP